MTIKETDKKYVLPTYGRLDLEIISGKGSTLVSADGKEYIDFGSGIAVNTFGACDDKWVDAVTNQLKKIQHTSNFHCQRLIDLHKPFLAIFMHSGLAYTKFFCRFSHR